MKLKVLRVMTFQILKDISARMVARLSLKRCLQR